MTTPTEDSSSPLEPPNSLPTATVSRQRGLLESKFWILTGMALLLAIGLAWWSTPIPGTRISIHFPDGHGLHEGDSVRYRGIKVGTVREIRLSDREGVDVSAEMEASASRLLKEGTRFWIVRPQLALTGVSGLETAVGPKYIAVEPDGSRDDAPSSADFDGLAQPPATSLNGDGIEIVLRADKQFSVRPGSSVAYRGFEVGRILDVRLSDDARFVDLRASIKQPYQKLVTSKTKFWANSGVDVDFSLRGGLSLDTESLESIARGGVSFLTIESDGNEVVTGQVFTLHEQSDDKWLEQANRIRLPTVKLKGAVTLVLKATRSSFLGRKSVTRLASAIPVRTKDGKTGIFVPSDILTEFSPDKESVDGVTIDGFSSEDSDNELRKQLSQSAADLSDTDAATQIVLVPLNAGPKLSWQTLVTAENVSGVLAVRRPVGASGDLYVHQPIAASQLAEQPDGTLTVSGFEGAHDLWNGCPILSADSGEIIGAMVADGRRVTIIPTNQLLEQWK